MKNSRIWELLKEVVKDEIEENNINENELKEGLYYNNGNDGTEFDIKANEQLCEIGKMYKDDCYAVKLSLKVNGELEIYTYPDLKDIDKCIENTIRSFITEDEFKEFASNLYEHTDKKEIFDDKINENIFEKPYKFADVLFEDEVEEEYDEEYEDEYEREY